MKRLVCGAVLACLLILAAPSQAATYRGNLNPNSVKAVGVVSLFDTQLIVTVFNKKKAAWPLVTVGCEGVILAQTVGVFENFARVEVAIPGGLACVVGLSSVQGSSQYWANVEVSTSRSSEVPIEGSSPVQMAPMPSSDFPWLEAAVDGARRLYRE